MTADLADRVRDVLDVDADAFEAQARADAEVVKEGLRDGVFDNHQAIVGFEYEFYAGAPTTRYTHSRASLDASSNSSASRRNWVCTTPR
jgi:hypothetical protein